MSDKVREQIKWLVGELLRNTSGNVVMHIVYDERKKEAQVYQGGEKVAIISDEASSFTFPLTDKQIAELYEITK